MKKNGRGSGSDNNDSVSYLGDEDDDKVHENESNRQFQHLRNKAHKLKEQKKLKKQQSKQNKKLSTSIDMELNTQPLQTIENNNLDKSQMIKVASPSSDLNAFFEHQKNISHLPTVNN